MIEVLIWGGGDVKRAQKSVAKTEAGLVVDHVLYPSPSRGPCTIGLAAVERTPAPSWARWPGQFRGAEGSRRPAFGANLAWAGWAP